MKSLFDSAIIIDVLRGLAPAKALLASLDRAPHLSVVTISELLDGQRGPRELLEIDAFLERAVIHDVTIAVARISGGLMQRYRRSHGLATLDALIAVTALHHGLSLVTLNVKHFPMFPGLARPY